jgi:hypothetical protein
MVVDLRFRYRVLREVLGDPGAGAALFAAVTRWQERRIRVGDLPAFAVGGDVAGTPDPHLPSDGVVGHVPETGDPHRWGVGGVFAEVAYAVGDAVRAGTQPVGQLEAVGIGLAVELVGGRWAGDPSRQQVGSTDTVWWVGQVVGEAVVQDLGDRAGRVARVGGELAFRGAFAEQVDRVTTGVVDLVSRARRAGQASSVVTSSASTSPPGWGKASRIHCSACSAACGPRWTSRP